ncbi:MAG: glycosyltransferase family 4 protein [Eubacteriales bacterium]|nr:glycosyltransferase family 4 protein [Eubacteriales bacterium]
MKILIIRTFPNVMNVQNYNAQEVGLAKAFAALGHDCDVVYYCGKEADHMQELPCQGGKARILWLHGRGVLNNGLFPSLSVILPQYDIIQTNGYDQYTSWSLYHSGRKNVTVYHGSYGCAFNKRYNLRARVFDALFLALRRARLAAVPCFTKSLQAADFLRSKGFRDITPVGVGLDAERLEKAEPHPWVEELAQSKGDQKYMLYIGQLAAAKNIEFLLKTAANVMEKEPKTRLVIVGRLTDSAYGERLRPLGEALKGRVSYCKALPQSALKALYQTADVFLLPSHYEIFGMVLLEAMYFSVPAITTPNGGASMLIENGVTGFALELDEEKWADRIIEVLSDRFPAMGENGARLIRERFMWLPIARTMLEKYKAMLAGDAHE